MYHVSYIILRNPAYAGFLFWKCFMEVLFWKFLVKIHILLNKIIKYIMLSMSKEL